MTTPSTFDRLMERVGAGERLSADEIPGLAASLDILALGMLADTLRRHLHGTRVTYVRVAPCAPDGSFADAVPSAAREIRITGAPESLGVAAGAVARAKAVAGARTVSGFSWADVERLAAADSGGRVAHVLEALRDAGLDALAEIALDAADGAAAIDRLSTAGFDRLRLSIHGSPAADRTALPVQAARLQDRFACIQSINPLPLAIDPFQPSTGYEDVKMVAIARLAAPNVPSVQVDWPCYGPKLAQVALTFGADDVYGVSASDEAPDGRRRAALDEIRRNIEAAGFDPVERDGACAIVG